ncbi:MAG: AbiEi antitoxin N-terminal domain-containing protein [Solirubrobacterales bacterium]
MGDKNDIARLAAGQYGVVTAVQLQAEGFSRQLVSKLAAAGWLHRVHRGVYAVGHPGLSTEGRWMAAVLACGGGAVLSHRSAAQLWQMLKPVIGLIDVTVPTTAGRRRRQGVRLHRSPSVLLSTVTHDSGIPVTSPARTLGDLRGVISPGLHRKATRQAEFLGLDLGDVPGRDRPPPPALSATSRSGISPEPLRRASSPRFARRLHKISGCRRRSPPRRTGSCS